MLVDLRLRVQFSAAPMHIHSAQHADLVQIIHHAEHVRGTKLIYTTFLSTLSSSLTSYFAPAPAPVLSNSALSDSGDPSNKLRGFL